MNCVLQNIAKSHLHELSIFFDISKQSINPKPAAFRCCAGAGFYFCEKRKAEVHCNLMHHLHSLEHFLKELAEFQPQADISSLFASTANIALDVSCWCVKKSADTLSSDFWRKALLSAFRLGDGAQLMNANAWVRNPPILKATTHSLFLYGFSWKADALFLSQIDMLIQSCYVSMVNLWVEETPQNAPGSVSPRSSSLSKLKTKNFSLLSPATFSKLAEICKLPTTQSPPVVRRKPNTEIRLPWD